MSCVQSADRNETWLLLEAQFVGCLSHLWQDKSRAHANRTSKNDQVSFLTAFCMQDMFVFASDSAESHLSHYMGPCQVLPLQIRTDLGVMAMKRYSSELSCWGFTIKWFCVILRTLNRKVLPFCKHTVGVLYSPNWLG